MNYCCKEIANVLKAGEVNFIYNQKQRYYAITYQNKYGGGVHLIKFCPWCGKKLPKNLTDELFDIVIDKLNLDGLDDPNLPQEFKTDEWWKKRGL